MNQRNFEDNPVQKHPQRFQSIAGLDFLFFFVNESKKEDEKYGTSTPLYAKSVPLATT
jgi:hypothetical protein